MLICEKCVSLLDYWHTSATLKLMLFYKYLLSYKELTF